jgi:hypothetical protein
MISISEHQSVQLIIPLQEMDMCWVQWYKRVSDFHVSLSLIFWIQITYQ